MRRQCPELELARSDFERTEAAARAKNGRLPKARELVPVGLLVVLILAIILFFERARPFWLPGWMALPVVMLVTAVFIYLITGLTRETYRRGVREYLLGRGIALCLSCGYDLRGLTPGGRAASRCPECGAEFPDKVRELLAAQPDEPPRAD
ncbi:MAG: hypothetical protein SFZ24_10110 [Planctomycetota bacterium]|nr:hypothetical protein [Planctomycetota bacterium]